jgi:hypothetical protein
MGPRVGLDAVKMRNILHYRDEPGPSSPQPLAILKCPYSVIVYRDIINKVSAGKRISSVENRIESISAGLPTCVIPFCSVFHHVTAMASPQVITAERLTEFYGPTNNGAEITAF